MYKFDRSLLIKKLPRDVQEQLTVALNKDESWKIFAKCYAQTYEFGYLLQALENEKNQSHRLVKELCKHNIDVEILCNILKDCNLYELLSILQKPEQLEITVQSADQIAGNYLETSLGNVQLKCEAVGIPPPSYEWYHENKPMKKETLSYLNIDLTSKAQEGIYFCKVYQLNDQGDITYQEFSKPICIRLKNTPIVICKQPVEFLEVEQKDTLLLSCEATGYPLPAYQWYKNEEKLPNETSNGLTIHDFSPSKEGKYYCRITNGVEEKVSHQSLITTFLPRELATIKIALLIANQNYLNQEKLLSRRDVVLVEKTLKKLGFITISLTDLTLIQMKNAIQFYSNQITEGAYGFIYYSGHGVQVHNKYLLPVDIPNTHYTQKDMLSLNVILSQCLSKNPAVLVVVLDMCLEVPHPVNHPMLHTELPILNEFQNSRNLVLAFSTSDYNISTCPASHPTILTRYAELLCKYLPQDIIINRVFDLVGQAFESHSKLGQKPQIPTYSSSVTKPHRLVDKIHEDQKSEKVYRNLKKLLVLSNYVNVRSERANIDFGIRLSPTMEPFFNLVNLEIVNLDAGFRAQVYHMRTGIDYLASDAPYSRKCQVTCPRPCAGNLVISLQELNDETAIGAVSFDLKLHVPLLALIYKNCQC